MNRRPLVRPIIARPAHQVLLLLLLLTHLHLALLLLDPLQRQLPLVLQVLLLLLAHYVQLVRHLQLALAFRFFRLAAQLLAVLFAQRVQGGAGVLDLRQLVLQALVVETGVVVLLNVSE